MEHDAIIIYGGSSLIARELIKKLSVKYKKFIIFCRKKKLYRSIYKGIRAS